MELIFFHFQFDLYSTFFNRIYLHKMFHPYIQHLMAKAEIVNDTIADTTAV